MTDEGDKEIQAHLLELVKEVGTIVSDAQDVLTVTQALSLLASLLFGHVRCEALSGNPSLFKLCQIAQHCKDQVNLHYPNKNSLEIFREHFYGGLSFSTMAKILLLRVAPDWLACFSFAERASLFDLFFTSASPINCLLTLAPALAHTYDDIEVGLSVGAAFVSAVAERLLVVSLLEGSGVKKMAVECAWVKNNTSSVVQLIASIPDKARSSAPMSLHSPHYYLSATSQVLDGAEELWQSGSPNCEKIKDGFFVIGQLLGKFCRRGHADILASEIVSRLLHVIEGSHNLNQMCSEMAYPSPELLILMIENITSSSFWGTIMSSIMGVHAVERFAKALLLEMADKQVNDWQAYCILSILFSGLFSEHLSVRLIFVERFLFWDVFPICCLRWILQFGVFCCPPSNSSAPCSHNMKNVKRDVIKHLVEVWSGKNFVQSYDTQQQNYISAAVSLSIRALRKEDLETLGNVLQMLLEGISHRLESPLDLIRLMAKKVALAFSLVIDEKNPLLLDDEDGVEVLSDWELPNLNIKLDHGKINDVELDKKCLIVNDTALKQRARKIRDSRKFEAYDPDEVIDMTTYEPECYSDEESELSDAESESSLQPYSLSDDESDLMKEKVPTQLIECATNLRKGDDPDAVEKALEVAEKLIRLLPDELENVAADLAHALIHVQCGAITIQGEEQAAEDRRYNALVGLLACAPKTVGVLCEQFYSPHLDVSQRLLILEVMSDAARELAASSTSICAYGSQRIEEINAAWYGPGNTLPSSGAGPWRRVEDSNTMVSFVHKYERELTRKPESRTFGKPQRRSERSLLVQQQQHRQADGGRKNMFVPLAASFMLPLMRDYDKKQHGIDLLGRDFIVLARLICMLGVCVECISMYPEAIVLVGGLLNMLRSRQISNHQEPYVRRASLYAASRILVSLHPAYVANALRSGVFELSDSLDWIHTWTLFVVDNCTDAESSSIAMVCLQLHAELMLQASRSMSIEGTTRDTGGSLSYRVPVAATILLK